MLMVWKTYSIDISKHKNLLLVKYLITSLQKHGRRENKTKQRKILTSCIVPLYKNKKFHIHIRYSWFGKHIPLTFQNIKTYC